MVARFMLKTATCPTEKPQHPVMRGTAAAGGRQEVPPDTLLRGFRGRWEAEKDTWNAFAGIPCQVDGRR